MTFALKTLSGLALVGLLAGTGASAMAPQGDHDLGSEINTTGVRVIAQATPAPIAPTARTARATQQGDHANARETLSLRGGHCKRHASSQFGTLATQQGSPSTAGWQRARRTAFRESVRPASKHGLGITPDLPRADR